MELERKIRKTPNLIETKDILGEDFVGKFVATVTNRELLGNENKISFITLSVNNESYRIRTPSHIAWRKKAVGDRFAITKQVKENKCTLIPSKIFKNKNGLQTLPISDIYELHGVDATKDKIIGLNIMEIEEDHYVAFVGKKLIRVHKTFKFLNPFNFTIGLGTKIYIDASDDSKRSVDVLGVRFDDARLKYLDKHGQDKVEKQTFEKIPTTKDKFAEYHAIKNIDLVSRKYEGLVFLKAIELTKKAEGNYFRYYMYAKVNDNATVMIKLSKYVDIELLRNKEVLIMQKRIYAGSNGNDLARLTMINTIEDYTSIESKNLYDLLIHKYGLKYRIDIDLLYVDNEYACFYAEESVHKINVNSIPSSLLADFKLGNKLFRIKPKGLHGIEVLSRKIQCKSLS